jgi:hypothetical protein
VNRGTLAYSGNYLLDVKFGVIVDVERPGHPPSRGRCSENHDRANSALVLGRRGWRPIRLRGGADAELVARGEGIAPHIPVIASQSERMAPFHAATFDVTRQVTSIAARAESSLELRCMRAASRKIHATSISMRETLPGRLPVPKALSGR